MLFHLALIASSAWVTSALASTTALQCGVVPLSCSTVATSASASCTSLINQSSLKVGTCIKTVTASTPIYWVTVPSSTTTVYVTTSLTVTVTSGFKTITSSLVSTLDRTYTITSTLTASSTIVVTRKKMMKRASITVLPISCSCFLTFTRTTTTTPLLVYSTTTTGVATTTLPATTIRTSTVPSPITTYVYPWTSTITHYVTAFTTVTVTSTSTISSSTSTPSVVSSVKAVTSSVLNSAPSSSVSSKVSITVSPSSFATSVTSKMTTATLLASSSVTIISSSKASSSTIAISSLSSSLIKASGIISALSSFTTAVIPSLTMKPVTTASSSLQNSSSTYSASSRLVLVSSSSISAMAISTSFSSSFQSGSSTPLISSVIVVSPSSSRPISSAGSMVASSSLVVSTSATSSIPIPIATSAAASTSASFQSSTFITMNSSSASRPLSTSTTTVTSSSVLPTSSATSCSNMTSPYSLNSSNVYDLYCNQDVAQNDIRMDALSQTFQACLDSCSATSGCVAITFVTPGTNNPAYCFLKSAATTPYTVDFSGPQTDSAILRNTPLSTTTSLSLTSASSSSATSSATPSASVASCSTLSSPYGSDPTKKYDLYCNQDVAQNDIRMDTVPQTFQDCINYCSATSNCVAITFVTPGTNNPAYCFLKSAATTPYTVDLSGPRTDSAILRPVPVNCKDMSTPYNNVLASDGNQLFDISCNQDLGGSDFHMERGTANFKTCLDLCSTTPGCVAMTFVSPTDSVQSWCWLKNSIPALSAPPAGPAIDSASLRPETCSQMTKPYTDYQGTTWDVSCGTDAPGGDIINLSSSSLMGCVYLCTQNSDCVAVAYVWDQQMCWLKGSLGAILIAAPVDYAVPRWD